MNTIIKKLIRDFFAVIFTVAALQVNAQSGKYESMDTAISRHMSDMKVPGFAIGIVKGRSLTWSKAYGQANIAGKLPMNIDAVMNIGSISKTFTTIAAMRLWEKGKLDLNADIDKYLDFDVRNPKYPEKPITVWQIMTHTSSIKDGKAYGNSYSCGDPVISLQEWIHESLTTGGRFYNNGDNFGDWSPDAGRRRYSNVSFGLLGLIVEKIAGQPFNEYCNEHIFKPLGMKNTGWMLREITTSNVITPYVYVTENNRNNLLGSKHLYPESDGFQIGTFIPTCLYSFPNYPDGLVHTSLRELSYYLSAMMNGGKFKGKRILRKATINKMLSLQNNTNKFQGLTWHIYEWDTPGNNEVLWGHTGSDPGITTYLFFNPISKSGMITFQNASTDGTGELFERLYRLAQ